MSDDPRNKLDPLAHLRLLDRKQVCAITGYSANHIYRRMRAGTFPQSVRIGPNSVRWYEHEVMAWLAACPRGAAFKDSSDQPQPPA